MVKVLLDTDIGTNIDDALCLAYLLAQPACELVGITTVWGDVERRAMIASAICRASGKSVPIYAGAAKPLLVDVHDAQADHAGALPKWSHEVSFPRGQAIDFMRRTIHRYPGQVVLLTVGPLTNAALLFAVDPEAAFLLRGITLMCGSFHSGSLDPRAHLEWNAMLDPHATAIVYRAPVGLHTSIGLDVTTQVRMDAAVFRDRLQHPLLKPLLDFSEAWFRTNSDVTFHDPLAAATLFDPELCSFQRGNVLIELANPSTLGSTYWNSDSNGRHATASAVNSARVLDHYFSVFS